MPGEWQQLHITATLPPQKKLLISIEKQDGWASQPVCRLWRR